MHRLTKSELLSLSEREKKARLPVISPFARHPKLKISVSGRGIKRGSRCANTALARCAERAP